MFNDLQLWICYIDECGDENPIVNENDLPHFVMAGLVVPQAKHAALLDEFLEIKRQVFAGENLAKAELVRRERKGSNLRSGLRDGRRGNRRATIAFLDAVVALLERHAVMAAVTAIARGSTRLPWNQYELNVETLLREFTQLVAPGLLLTVLDSRTHSKNSPTVRHMIEVIASPGGDLSSLVEAPLFGHSDTHALLQLADIFASALLAPLLAFTTDPTKFKDFEVVNQRYGHRIQALIINPLTGKLTS